MSKVRGLLAAAAFAVAAHGWPSAGQAQGVERAVRGIVSGPSGDVIAGVEIRLVVAGRTMHVVLTDTTGRFQFGTVPAGGDAALHVRRLGYQPAVVHLSARRQGDVVVRLDVVAEELLGVVVTAHRGSLAEFHAHRARSSFGTFFTPDDIATQRPRMLSELMRGVPGARLLPGRFGSLVRLRGCRPTLWVDGVRIRNAELDETINIEDVAAVEVYNSFAGIPAQYVDRATNCGAVVVWIKS